MSGIAPKAAGWYPDPDILPASKAMLRYWNGRHWTERRRPVPMLTRLEIGTSVGIPFPRVLEGPARVAELPARAAEVPGGRDAPGGRADTLDRPRPSELRSVDMPTATGGGRGVPPEPPQSGGGGGDGGSGGGGDDGAGDRARPRSRRKWWLLAAAAVTCALAVVLAAQALQPPSPGPRVVTDTAFVTAANALCAKVLPGLRPTDGGAFGSIVSATNAASDIDKAATGLDGLANQLSALPDTAIDAPFVSTWLGEWHQYASLGRQYADFLRQHGTTDKEPQVLKTGGTVAAKASNFALANHLNACQFTYVDTSNASDM
ncbi:MAG: DUF2510 domain-containing protein [Acidimicrobiales bacterium]